MPDPTAPPAGGGHVSRRAAGATARTWSGRLVGAALAGALVVLVMTTVAVPSGDGAGQVALHRGDLATSSAQAVLGGARPALRGGTSANVEKLRLPALSLLAVLALGLLALGGWARVTALGRRPLAALATPRLRPARAPPSFPSW